VLRYLKSIWALIAPDLCPSCQAYHRPKKGVFCPACISTLSVTRTLDDPYDNELIDKFGSNSQIHQGLALYYLDEDSVLESVIYAIKYSGRADLAYEIGLSFGRQLNEKNLCKDIDFIIPVPLHKKKLKKRGYNQSQAIVEGMATVLGMKVNTDALVRIKNTVTQTDMTKEQRLLNVEGAFVLQNTAALKGAHVLLVDDVVTTGATCTACIDKLNQVDGIKLSVATIALPIDM